MTYVCFDAKRVHVAPPAPEGRDYRVLITSASLDEYRRLWRHANDLRVALYCDDDEKTPESTVRQLTDIADAYLEMVFGVAALRCAPQAYRYEQAAMERRFMHMGLQGSGLTEARKTQWRAAAVRFMVHGWDPPTKTESWHALERFRYWLTSISKWARMCRLQPAGVGLFERGQCARDGRRYLCEPPPLKAICCGQRRGGCPMPAHGVSGDALKELWRFYGGQLAIEREHQHAPYEHKDCMRCNEARYQHKLEAKRADWALQRIHKVVAPGVKEVCKDGCSHLEQGMTPAQAKAYLDDLQSEIANAYDYYRQNPYQEWNSDDLDHSIMARDAFVRDLDDPAVTAAFVPGRARAVLYEGEREAILAGLKR